MTLCQTCRYWTPYEARIGGKLTTAYRCAQGVPDTPRVRCIVWEREPGTD